jgi:hypothetical protein
MHVTVAEECYVNEVLHSKLCQSHFLDIIDKVQFLQKYVSDKYAVCTFRTVHMINSLTKCPALYSNC